MPPQPAYPPAPWEAHELSAKTRLVLPNAQAYVTVGPPTAPGNRVIAVIYSVDGCHATSITKLIAASPALFPALRDVMGWYDHSVVYRALSAIGEQSSYHATLNVARRALLPLRDL